MKTSSLIFGHPLTRPKECTSQDFGRRGKMAIVGVGQVEREGGREWEHMREERERGRSNRKTLYFSTF